MNRFIVGSIASLALASALPTIAADASQSGDWAVGVNTDSTVVFRATRNESGSVFGEYCNLAGDSCRWIIETDAICEQNVPHHPALGNSDAGAFALTLRCEGKIGSNYRYVFEDPKELIRLLATGTRIGFALPLQQDQFFAVKFSLVGVKKTEDLARQLAAKTRGPVKNERL